MKKRLVVIAAAIGVVGVVVVAGVLLLPRVLPGGVSIQLGAGDSAAASSLATPPPMPAFQGGDLGVPVTLGERIVNLADPGGFRYLKVEIVLSLSEPGLFSTELSTEELHKHQERLRAVMEPFEPQVQDILTTVLSSRTVDEVASAEGKTLLREELIERLQPLFRQQHISGLYFAQFVVQ